MSTFLNIVFASTEAGLFTAEASSDNFDALIAYVEQPVPTDHVFCVIASPDWLPLLTTFSGYVATSDATLSAEGYHGSIANVAFFSPALPPGFRPPVGNMTGYFVAVSDLTPAFAALFTL